MLTEYFFPKRNNEKINLNVINMVAAVVRDARTLKSRIELHFLANLQLCN